MNMISVLAAMTMIALIGQGSLIAVEISLRPQVTIDHLQPTIGDIAEIISADQQQHNQLAALPLPPLSGAAGILVTPAEVRAVIGRQLAALSTEELSTWQITGASRVMARAQVITIDDQVAVARYHLQQTLASDLDRITIAVQRPPTPVQAPAAFDIAIIAEPLVHQLAGEVPYRLLIRDGEREIARRLMVFRIDAIIAVPHLTADLRAGTILTKHHLQWRQRPLANGEPRPPTADQLLGQALRVDARLGSAVQRHWVEAPRLVSGKELVTLRYRQGAIEVTSSATALADGALDESVRVRQANGRVVTAVVTGPGEVMVGR